MIREVMLVGVLCAAAPAFAGVSDAAEPPAPAPVVEPPATTATGAEVDETTLKAHRTPFEVLSERMIGVASRAVRYDWRKSTFQIAVTGSQLLELNNFNSVRLGGALRASVSSLMVEVGLAYVWTFGSAASNQLSLTPYRQAGRPARVELDLIAGLPFAEGVTTPRFGFLPPMELVFMLNAGVRARWYGHELDGFQGTDGIGAFFAPRLSDKQVENLEYGRLPGMEVDRSRYDVLAGFSLSAYFQNGIFICPRIMFAPPLISAAAGSTMVFWWDLTLQLGWSY